MRPKKQQQSLLVLTAMATLAAPLSSDLALIAYAAHSVETTNLTQSNTLSTQLMPIQTGRYRYDLMSVTTQTLPTVRLETGQSGEVLKQSFTIQKLGTTYLNFNLTLSGPTDSRVTIKIDGKTYFTQTVGRGQLAEASFFTLSGEGEATVEIEYQVGEGEEVLSNQPFVEFSNLVATSQAKPERPLEYRVKGTDSWVTYHPEKGIEAFIYSKQDTLPIEWRYQDEVSDTISDLMIQAPAANLPLLKLEKDGLFYLNHFNTLYNDYEQLEVRFNQGSWQPYEPGMSLEWLNDECFVDVKVVNNYGIETILPTQRYQLPTLNQATIHHENGVVTLSSSNLSDLKVSIEYQLNDGKWTTYKEPFNLSFKEGEARLNVRVTDVFGRSTSTLISQWDAPQPTGGDIRYQNGLVSIQPFSTQYALKEEKTMTYYRVNEEDWLLYQKPFQLQSRHWTEQGVKIETKGVNQFGAESSIQTLTLSKNQQQLIQPSISMVRPQSGVLRTHEPIRFEIIASDRGGMPIQTTEWSLNGKDWMPYTETVETTFQTKGTHTLYFRTTNEAGLVSEVYEQQVTVQDAMAPVVTGISFKTDKLYVQDTHKPSYHLNYENGTTIEEVVWGGDYETMFKTPGQKTITLKVRDNRGLWSNTYTYTFEVKERKAPVIEQVIPSKNRYVEGDTIAFDFKVTYDHNATFKKVEWLEGYPFSNQLGTHQIKFRVQDNYGYWSEPFTFTYQVESAFVEPMLTFSTTTLKVPYGSTLKSIYQKETKLQKGSATSVSYSAATSTFNPNKLGKQKVKYTLTYKQNGVQKTKTVYRDVEVTTVDPTLTFSTTTLKTPYGSTLKSIYKKEVTLQKGSATSVSYTADTSTFNPKKLGKQKVKYTLTYNQNGKKQTKTVYRYIEVTAVNPTLTFSKTTLTVKKGKTPNFNQGVSLNKGSATQVTYQVVKSSFNANKKGTQRVKYQLSYKQNGKSYKTTVERLIKVN